MAYNARNIILGAAALFLSASDSTVNDYGTGPALPTAPATAGASIATGFEADATNWRHAGYTSEGLELAYEPEWTDIEVDQLLDSARIFKTSMRATINTTFVEAQLENLLVAWGQGAATLDPIMSTDTTPVEIGKELGIAGGALGDEPVERALAAVGPSPRSAAGERRERVYHARRVLSVDAVSVAIRRDEATTFPVSFRLLPDSNFPGAEYGVIRDRNLV